MKIHEEYMGTDKVIFVGEQWGATGSDVTGSHMTGRGDVQNWKYVMRNRKFRNAHSGAFSQEVTTVTGSDCVRMRHRYILNYY